MHTYNVFFNVLILIFSPHTHSLDDGTWWMKPSTLGEWDVNCDCFRGPEFGWSTFISHEQLRRRDFLKNDDLIITANFDGKNISDLPVENAMDSVLVIFLLPFKLDLF